MSENNTDLNEVFEEEMDDADVITVPIDETLSNSGEAADAAAVGAALALKADKDELPATIKVNNQSADNQGLILIDGTDIPVSDSNTKTLAEAIEEASEMTAATIPMTGETGAATIGETIGVLQETVEGIAGNMSADKIPMSEAEDAETIAEAIGIIADNVEELAETVEGMEQKTADKVLMETGSTVTVKNAIETLDRTAVKSVNRKLPDASGDVDLPVVPLAENLQSDKLQSIEGEFTLRTTGGTGSVSDGKAYPQHIYGNSRHDGFVAEVLNLTVIPIARTEPDEPITATIDRDTFLEEVEDSDTINLYYTTEWSEDPADYGVTVTGDPVAGDQITIVYVKEVRGTIVVAEPDRLVGTGWNLFNYNAGYARVVKYSETYGYKIGGTFTSIAFAASLTDDRISLLPNIDGLFSVPGDGYVFVTGGNNTDTYILTTWSDWIEGPSTGYWEAYRESGIDLSAVVETYFPYGMLKVGTVRDEIDLVAKRTISRIERMVYNEENRATAAATGRAYDFDENNIYVVRAEPVLNAITIDSEYSVSEHGLEWFTETELPLDTEILYGKNLRDKLERNVLTISAQTLTEEEKSQVRTNIGAMSQAEGDTKLVAPTEAGTAGQLLHLKEDGSTEWTTQGTPTDAQVGTAVSAWLTAHPEATTTVEDGAISRAKLNDDLKAKTDAVPDLKSALGKSTGNEELIGWSENHKYIITNGDTADITSPTTTTSNVRYQVIQCQKGDYFTITATGGNASRAYAFINNNDNGKILEPRAGSGAVLTDQIIVAPANSTHLIVNDTTLAGKVITGRFVKLDTLKQHGLLDNSDNLNDCKETGLYRWAGSSMPSNAPADTGSIMFVINQDDTVEQIVFTRREEWHRFYAANEWAGWKNFINPFVQRKVLTSQDDLNNVYDNGVYSYTSSSVPSNAPVPATGGLLNVFGINNLVYQIYTNAENEEYHRHRQSSGWGTWIRHTKPFTHMGLLTSADNLNNITESGIYVIYRDSIPVNNPSASGGLLVVYKNGISNDYYEQLFYNRTEEYHRFKISYDESWGDWKAYGDPLAKGKVLTSNHDLNEITDTGYYQSYAGNIPENSPEETGGILTVIAHDTLVQQTWENKNGKYFRIKISTGWVPWKMHADNDMIRVADEQLNIVSNLIFEQGRISSTDGTNVNDNTRIRTNNFWYSPINESSVIIKDSDKKLFVFEYNTDDSYVRSSGWIFGSDSFALRLGKKYRFVVAYLTNEQIDTSAVIDGIIVAPSFTNDNIPVMYLDGDITEMTKENAVTLNYRFFDLTGTCTCKWQGQSSTRYPKKNYTLKFGSSFDGWAKWQTYMSNWKSKHNVLASSQTDGRKTWKLVDNKPKRSIDSDYTWGNKKKYVAKANWIDPSQARNVVSARLWGQIVNIRRNKIGLLEDTTNGGAIDGFPIQIVLNGGLMGLYTFTTPKDENLFAMGSGESEYFIGGEINAGSNNVAKSANWLRACDDSDLYDTDASHSFAIEYPDVYGDNGEPTEETQETFNAIKTSLNNAITACLSAGATWETDCADYIDVDSVIDYYIFACCINANDCMSKNILYGTYNGVKWFMSAYDLDTTYGANPYNSGWFDVVNERNQFAEAAEYNRENETYRVSASRIRHRLFYLVHRYSRAKLVERYKELRATVLSDENVWAELSKFVTDIPQTMVIKNNEIWPTSLGTELSNIHQYMDYYRMHCKYLDEEIAELEATLT